VVTRKDGGEFPEYWNGDETPTIPHDKPLRSMPLFRQIKDGLIVIVNGSEIDTDNTEFGIDLLDIINDSRLNITEKIEGSKVGLLSHGGAESPDISLISTQIAFNSKYSSSQGEHFCQYVDSTFLALKTKPKERRKGVYDFFRDEFVFADNDERLYIAFDELWNHYEKKCKIKLDSNLKLELLHHCRTPFGAKKLKEMEYFTIFKDMEIDGVSLSQFVEEMFACKVDNKSQNYNRALKKLRDKLLN
jgi:hypothetical protein